MTRRSGLAFVATRGQAHFDVQRSLARARALCHQVADSPQLFRALGGLFSFHVVRSELSAACDVAGQLASLAEREPDSTLRLVTHWAFGQTLLFQGEFAPACEHLEQGIGLYDRREHHGLGLRAGFPGDLGVFCHCFAAHTRWHLGYPDQALLHHSIPRQASLVPLLPGAAKSTSCQADAARGSVLALDCRVALEESPLDVCLF